MPPHCIGHRTKGRCLAATNKLQAAEEAFESALKNARCVGFFFTEILVLRDLKLYVLDKDGRAEEGSTRLRTSIYQLFGAMPAADQVEALASELGPGVDLGAVLDHD